MRAPSCLRLCLAATPQTTLARPPRRTQTPALPLPCALWTPASRVYFCNIIGIYVCACTIWTSDVRTAATHLHPVSVRYHRFQILGHPTELSILNSAESREAFVSSQKRNPQYCKIAFATQNHTTPNATLIKPTINVCLYAERVVCEKSVRI